MDKWPYSGWAMAGWDAWTLGMESSTVMGLRVARIAMGGPGAGEEAARMVSEKVQSAIELQTALVTGRLGTTPLAATQKTLRHYRRKVKANRKRLG
ncbi:MAG: hypothetical protein EOP62_18770 [Sphingomonadales bacterium]|nr:MAG: hypothetical protein EOP62_18770 [Sphingomonadales bacterium]